MSKPTAVWGLAAAMIAVMMLGLSLAPSITRAATLPAQFSDDLVASVGSPTSLAFTPDGRLLITTQGGQLRVVENGTLLPAPALSLGSNLCTNSERGLLGVAVHPSFAGTRYVYLFYTSTSIIRVLPASRQIRRIRLTAFRASRCRPTTPSIRPASWYWSTISSRPTATITPATCISARTACSTSGWWGIRRRSPRS